MISGRAGQREADPRQENLIQPHRRRRRLGRLRRIRRREKTEAQEEEVKVRMT
jgi:hypothetical protein